MRSLKLFQARVLLFCFIFFVGCYDAPYFDLHQPIYLVTDSSFWAGCEEDAMGYEGCQARRTKWINKGVDQWFSHFDEATRPYAVVSYSDDELPSNRVNETIYLYLDPGFCGVKYNGKRYTACYSWGHGSSPKIVFDAPLHIAPIVMAHELGHVLGRGHEDTQEGVYSVMSYEFKSLYVLPVDIDLMCSMHGDCPPYKNIWCEGSFYDPCRCPSASYQEGVAKLKAGEISTCR